MIILRKNINELYESFRRRMLYCSLAPVKLLIDDQINIR